MINKRFTSPLIILSDNPGDDVVIGGGTGQGTIDPGNVYPCNFAAWQQMYEGDYNFDEVIDFEDYGQWWADNKFSIEEWEKFNPGVEFTWEPSE